MATIRPTYIVVGERSLRLPVFFPSISSVKTALLPQEYLQLIASLAGLAGQFLASAYDLSGLSDPAAYHQSLPVDQ